MTQTLSSNYVVPLPGFHLIRNDSAVGGGGSVAIYLSSYIPFTNIDISVQPPPSNTGKHLLLEVGVYYCPFLRIIFFDP